MQEEDPGHHSGQHVAAATRRLAAAVLVAVAAVSVAILARLEPPPAAPATAPASEFSAERAMEHVRVLAAAPRPVGSPQHRAARDYLVDELASLGLAAEVQEAVRGRLRGDYLVAARVENVVARLLGQERGEALLLLAHYDSTPQAPGAGDDASGVAVILETLRALLAGQVTLERDLIVLFTDGEELGLFGAHAFVDEHPWAGDVGWVLNFEARGTSGPSLMFESGHPNAAAVRLFRDHAPHPWANSLTDAVYQRMPNDTDFTVFRRDLGVQGLNFAFMEGFTGYHSPLDNPRHLDPSSLQHHGESALALSRALLAGAGGLEGSATAGESVYFDLQGAFLVAYPEGWAPWIAVAALLLWIVAVVLARRRGATSGRGVLTGGVATLVAAVIAAVAATALWRATALVFPSLVATPHGAPYVAVWFELAVVTLVVAVALATFALGRRRATPWGLGLGALGVWVLLAIVTAFALPGGSYLFVWPTLLGGAAVLIALLPPSARRVPPSTATVALVLTGLAVSAAALLLVPTIRLLFVALTLEAAGAVAVVIALFLSLLAMPLTTALRRPLRWSAGLAVLALVLAIAGVVGDRPGMDRPRVDSVYYIAEREDARWWSRDETIGPYGERLMGDGAERGTLPAALGAEEGWSAAAPKNDLSPPRIDLVSDVDRPGEDGAVDAEPLREVTLRVASARRAPVLRMRLASPLEENDEGDEPIPLGLAALHIDGERFVVDPESSEVGLAVFGIDREAVSLVLELVGPRREIVVAVADQTWGLPAGTPARPPEVVAAPSWVSDSTVVHRDRRLPARRVPLGASQWDPDR